MEKIVFVLLTNLYLISLPALTPTYAADWTPGKCYQNFTINNNVNKVATLEGIECLFSNVVSVVLALAGITLFIMLLNGGFKFLTSGEDQKQLEAAKGTLTHAIIGLLLLVFAFVIIQLISNVTGVVGIQNFKIVQ